jgi:hypothetical protein
MPSTFLCEATIQHQTQNCNYGAMFDSVLIRHFLPTKTSITKCDNAHSVPIGAHDGSVNMLKTGLRQMLCRGLG